jgi:hypothetical protein
MKGSIDHVLTNTIACKSLSYLLSCTSRMSYWLMGMTAIERVYITWYMQGTWLKSPRIAKRIIATIIIGILAFDVHEAIYYQTMQDPKASNMNNNTWCVTTYSSAIATYNQINIILNYIMPLLINLVSTIILIVLITRQRALAMTKKADSSHAETNVRSTFRAYIGLLILKKELILAPLITMLPQLFTLPQFILSYLLACQEFKVNWLHYLLITSYYFANYTPQALSYTLYISPSTFYKKEYRATNFYKKISKWRQLIVRKQTETIPTIANQTTDHSITVTKP